MNEELYTFDGSTDEPLKLAYFDIKGKAEGIRLALYHSKINFVDSRFPSREVFKKQKESGVLPYGQVPLLILPEGFRLAQSTAIMRYVGKLGGLYPTDDPVAACKIDAAADQVTDMFAGVTVSLYKERFGFGFLNDRPADVAAVRKDLTETVLPRHLGDIEKSLKTDPSRVYLTGRSEPSIADFVLVPQLQKLMDGGVEGIDPRIFTGFPKVCRLVEAFNALPSVVEFTAERERRKAAK